MARSWPKEIGFFAREGDGGAVNTSKGFYSFIVERKR